MNPLLCNQCGHEIKNRQASVYRNTFPTRQFDKYGNRIEFKPGDLIRVSYHDNVKEMCGQRINKKALKKLRQSQVKDKDKGQVSAIFQSTLARH